MITLFQDIRYGLRILRKSPGFTAVAVITLALGIGANTVVYSVVQGVVLAPLPFNEPDRLVMIWENNPRFPRVWGSYPNFLDWQRTARSLTEMAAFRKQGVDLTAPGTPEHLRGTEISSGFFSTLGVRLTLGRELSTEEDRFGGTPTVIISNRLWRNRFGGSPEALGKPVTLDGVTYAIVGVAPLGFRLESDADVFTPLGQGDPLELSVRSSHDGIFTVARLQPGATIVQAQAEMGNVQNNLDQLYPDANRDLGIYVEPLKQAIVGNVGGTLVLLLGAVGLVLLIACANFANLLLARSAARSREFAVRSALGANRARIVRQVLTESVFVSLAGAGLGVLIALWGVRLVIALVAGSLPRSENIGVNAPVLLFTLGVSLAVGILFGLAPALKSWNANPQVWLKDGGRSSTAVHNRTQNGLVIVQIALALVLLVAAGLLLRTLSQLGRVHPGFDIAHVLSFKVGVSSSLTKTPESTRTAYQQLIERIRQVPGVQAAEITDTVPLSGQGGFMPFWLDSQKPVSLQGATRLQAFLTGPDYLRTMEIRLLRGRFLALDDTINSPCVAVIDNVFARNYFRDSDPMRHSVTAGFASFGPCRIVGVVAHVKNFGLGESSSDNQSQAYYSLQQDPAPWVPSNYRDASIVVRTSIDPGTIIPSIKAVVYGEGGNQTIYNVRTMQQIVSDSMSVQRFPMMLLGSFALLALVLAAVGTYGVISYSVMQRGHEIGVRMALGAGKPAVFLLVIRQSLKLAVAGVVLAIPGAFILTRTLFSSSQLLYGVSASDPLTFVAASLMLTAVALLASYIPARRAAMVDPIVALRYE